MPPHGGTAAILEPIYQTALFRYFERCIEASSDVGDVVWEPFGGLCSVAIAAHQLKRVGFSAEVNADYFEIAVKRLENYDVF